VGGTRYGPGWASVPAREWKEGDTLGFTFGLTGRVVEGAYTNYSHAAAAWGPFVLAVDTAQNTKLDSLESLRLAKGAEPTLVSSTGDLSFALKAWDKWDENPRELSLVPFADAGANGSQYRIWLRASH